MVFKEYLQDWALSKAFDAYTKNYGTFNLSGPFSSWSSFKKDAYNPPKDYIVKKKKKKSKKRKKSQEMAKRVQGARDAGRVKKAAGGRRKRKRTNKGVSKAVKKYISGRIKRQPLLGRLHTQKAIDSTIYTSDVNQCNYHHFSVGTRTELSDLMATYRDGGSSTQQDLSAKMNVAGIKVQAIAKIHYRNNSSHPVDMIIYFLCNKEFTSSSPDIYLAGRHTDATIGVTNATSTTSNHIAPNAYPSDSKFWQHYKRLKKTLKIRLNPGDEFRTSVSKVFRFNDDYDDITGQTYLSNKTVTILTRQIGVIAHQQDNPSAVGYSNTQVDVIEESIFKFRFVGLNEQQQLLDVDVDEGEGGNTLDTMTTPVTWGPNFTEDTFNQ